jgi:hypothetical protein
MLAAPEALQERVAAVARRYPGVVWVEPWVESNHSTFAMRGVPSIALTSIGGGEPAHLQSDTIERMSPAKLAEAAGLASAVAGVLQAIPGSIR